MPIDRKVLQVKIQNLKNLPPLPAAIQRVGQMVEDPKVTTQQLSDVIAKDQALASRVLRLVNSPLYGFPGRIVEISHAIVLLGFNVIKSLAFGTYVSGIMTKEIEGLWEHSLGTSLAAGILARKVGFPKPDEASVAGLLHDVGKAALKVLFPAEYRRVLQVVQEKQCFILEAEREVLGDFDHCRMGAELCLRWNLPAGLRDTILHHHDPGRAKQEKDLTAIVHTADVLARAFGVGFAGDPYVPALEKKAWEMLKLTWDDLEDASRDLQQNLHKVKDSFRF